VAAFSAARFGRVFLAQCVVALALAATALWFLESTWFPRAIEAIRALPATGSIDQRMLSTPRATAEPLAADNFIAFAINLDRVTSPGSIADVRVEFHRGDFTICSLLGCLILRYPNATLQFNQPELEAWWGAWRLTMITAIVLGILAFLFISWVGLAALYFGPVWLIAYFKDRQLSLAGSWKMTLAALLTPALWVGAALALYGLTIIDLLRFLVLWVLHVPLGWAYLNFAIRRLPRVAAPGSPRINPFDSPSELPGRLPSPNPFQARGDSGSAP
jgi:hypothetical protein